MQLSPKLFKMKKSYYTVHHYLNMVLTYTLVSDLPNNYCASVTKCKVDST